MKFTLKFAYLQVISILHGISDLAEQYKIYWNHDENDNYELHLEKYSNYNTQFNHATNVISVIGFYNIFTVMPLQVSSCLAGFCSLKPAQATVHYKIIFIVVYFLYIMLG